MEIDAARLPVHQLVVRKKVSNSLNIGHLSHNGAISPMMRTLLSALLTLARAALMPQATLALENAALRQQLTIYL